MSPSSRRRSARSSRSTDVPSASAAQSAAGSVRRAQKGGPGPGAQPGSVSKTGETGGHDSDGEALLAVPLDAIGPEGYDLERPLMATWVAEALGPKSLYAVTGAGRVELQLFRADDVIHVRGKVCVSVEAPCSRCLSPVRRNDQGTLEVALFPAGCEPQADADGEVSGDDLGVGTYSGEAVDVGAVVRDEVLLDLPMTPLCDEECRGLCSSCGANLNEGPCGCAPVVDMRWSALKNIKLD